MLFLLSDGEGTSLVHFCWASGCPASAAFINHFKAYKEYVPKALDMLRYYEIGQNNLKMTNH